MIDAQNDRGRDRDELDRLTGDEATLGRMSEPELIALGEKLAVTQAKVSACRDEAHRENITCAICTAAPKNTAFVPCGHRACAECIARLYKDVCPHCNQDFTDTLRLY